MSRQPRKGKVRDHVDHRLFTRLFSVPRTVTFLGIGKTKKITVFSV